MPAGLERECRALDAAAALLRHPGTAAKTVARVRQWLAGPPVARSPTGSGPPTPSDGESAVGAAAGSASPWWRPGASWEALPPHSPLPAVPVFPALDRAGASTSDGAPGVAWQVAPADQVRALPVGGGGGAADDDRLGARVPALVHRGGCRPGDGRGVEEVLLDAGVNVGRGVDCAGRKQVQLSEKQADDCVSGAECAAMAVSAAGNAAWSAGSSNTAGSEGLWIKESAKPAEVLQSSPPPHDALRQRLLDAIRASEAREQEAEKLKALTQLPRTAGQEMVRSSADVADAEMLLAEMHAVVHAKAEQIADTEMVLEKLKDQLHELLDIHDTAKEELDKAPPRAACSGDGVLAAAAETEWRQVKCKPRRPSGETRPGRSL